MAREGVTFEQVAAAADALVGAGQQPTIRAVREKLGDTGSPNTIHKLLAKWRDARPVAIASAPELPQALVTALATEIARAASQARSEVEADLAAERPQPAGHTHTIGATSQPSDASTDDQRLQALVRRLDDALGEDERLI